MTWTWGAYFDESGTDSKDPFLCMAGYIFKDDAFVKLDAEWKAMLDRHPDPKTGKPLPYFHMSECNVEKGIFANYSKPDCIQIAAEAIGLIKAHMSKGFAVSLDKKHMHLIPAHSNGFYTSAYTFACWMCLLSVRHFIVTKGAEGDFAYFFEEGHDHEGEARITIEKVLTDRHTKPLYRSTGSGFYSKTKVRPLQCADILAWQFNKHAIRRSKGTARMRGDFAELLRGQEDSYDIQILGEHNIKTLALSTSVAFLKQKWRSVFNLGEELIHDTLRRARM